MIRCLLAALMLLPCLAWGQATQQAVTQRGHLLCGVAGDVPGFSQPRPDGSMRGLDADYCRALAAVLLNDAAAVRFLPQPGVDAGIEALAQGRLDVLARNATLSFSRDAGQPVTGVGVLYFDGQGFLARGGSGIAGLADLAGRRVCVGTGGGLQAAAVLERFQRERGVSLTAVPAETSAAAFDAFLAGTCDAVTADRGALAGRRAVALPAPDAAILLPETISREPLGPLVRIDDQRFRQIAAWTLQALLVAEELGVSSASLVTAAQVNDPEIRTLLGVDGVAPPAGLPADWALRAIRAVGNYGEMFDRNLGQASGIGLDRGLNDLWRAGGLHFPLPLR